MPVRALPTNPSLDHLKHQAKDLRKRHKAREPDCARRIREFHPRFAGLGDAQIFDTPFSLGDAQLTVARAYGFANWMRLTRHLDSPTLADRLELPHHERIEDPLFRHAVDLLDSGDEAGLRSLLRKNPKLVRQQVFFEGKNYFRTPTLLEFIAENPIRWGRLPANIVDVARSILEAGPEMSARNEALTLVATGRVPRECGVQGELIALLCDFGADPNRALLAAAAHGEFAAVRALMQLGAKENLAVAAALGDNASFDASFSEATAQERWLALALGAQFGHLEIVEALLDAGGDPSRYNPPGAHAHSTPLHQAALAGHLAVVRLLVERGARLDLRDALFGGTPRDWAEHGGKTEISRYLRACEEKVATSG
jgi:hypothetical protein